MATAVAARPSPASGPPPPPARPPFARREVAAVAVGTVALLLALAGRYGYHRDELYFRVLAEDPRWGYVDQPLLTPLVARAALEVFGDSAWALRVPPALVAGALAVLLALLAREYGGGRTAQVVAATGTLGANPLIGGHLLLTSTLDWPLWVLAALFVSRALLHDRPRWWVAAGAVVGVALLNKLLIVLFVAGIVAGLAAVGPRRHLATPWPWLGALVGGIVAAPTLAYQVAAGFPQADMVGALTGPAARLLFLPGQALAIGPPAAVICAAGLVALLRRPELRPVRALAVGYLVACAVLVTLAGQFYYTTGFLLVLLAAGAVSAERWVATGGARRAHRSGHLWRTVAINAATSAVVALPLVPLGLLGSTPVPLLNPTAADQVGWREYAGQVARAYRSLPPGDQARAVVVTDNYGEAGAIDRYGPELGLPPVFSGHNALADLGPPPEDADVVVAVFQGSVAESRTFLLDSFRTCELAGYLTNGKGVPNEEEGTAVHVCRGPLDTWERLWPRFSYVGVSTFCEPCRRLDLA